MKTLLAAALIAAAPLEAPAASLPALAESQLQEAAAAAARYRDLATAQAEGWKRFGGDAPLMGEHWFLPRDAGGVDYVAGDPIDFARPSNLMYTEIGGRKVLTGVAYVVRLGSGEPPPAGFAGTADKWHVHDVEAALAAALQDRPILRSLANGWINQEYRKHGDERGRLAMVHAWVTLPNPDGIFADYNRTIPYLKLGLPAAFADGASEAAARGLTLAAPRGCAETLDGAIWIANTGRDKARKLREACASAAAHARAALPTLDKARINAMAAHGWAMFAEARDAILTPAQRQRVAALTEHGDHGADGSAAHVHR